MKYGAVFAGLDDAARASIIRPSLAWLKERADDFFNQQQLQLACDPTHTPIAWVQSLLDQAKGRSGGKVEQHLVGAKLERRFNAAKVPNNSGNAADVQTGRNGDFTLGGTVFHVTSAPGPALIDKCRANLAAALRPAILTPRSEVERATILAEAVGLGQRIMVLAIEEFIGANIIELSEGRDAAYLDVMKEIVTIYNRRLGEVETDLSLRIDID